MEHEITALSAYNLGLVHVYPDIFESATFSFLIKNFPIHTLLDLLRIYYFPL